MGVARNGATRVAAAIDASHYRPVIHDDLGVASISSTADACFVAAAENVTRDESAELVGVETRSGKIVWQVA